MKTLAIVVFVAAISLGGAWYYFNHVAAPASTQESEAEAPKPKANPVYWQFEPSFVVNLPDGAYMRYVKLDIAVMMHDAELPAVLDKHLPVLRSAVLMLVSSAQYDALLTLDGKEALRVAIIEALNARLLALGAIADAGEGIQDLYFTNFVMQ
ncbi:flagellar basal body-associated FliL family protein [Algiphilus sp. NNCM1]|uniref:flagellar basal body-associated FliL family protein n=1 Tax=Algiphilus sp. TaxID=1872431 RepID=UPI0025BAF825|nr:flagellar basal body-associated protein FliL [Algiphilus sp.]MBY8966981.1 flagellar basal body-associated FliL family protein [Algiphilus acroporae]MCI5103101.1 flagellar basal body-associated FliL family protein [Algiphilus sp.]